MATKKITFPVVIKREGVPLIPPPNANLYYILAAEGWYIVHRTPLYETCTKVDHPVPGYAEQEEYCRTTMPIIPNLLMDQVASFFRRVYEDLGGEAIVEIFHNPETREWQAQPPYQGVPQSTYGGSGYLDEFGYWVASSKYGSYLHGTGITPEYGQSFEDHADIREAPPTYEYFDQDLLKWVNCDSDHPKAQKKYRGTSGFHDLIYQPTTSAEWPPGFRRMGTIHSHPHTTAFFSSTDDLDDKYGDGLHLVFGEVDKDPLLIDKHVAASFCTRGHRFEWEKDDNDDIMEDFIDPDTAFPIEWLSYCHEVALINGRYRSVRQRPQDAVSEPKPVRNGIHRVAKPSNVRRTKK